MNKSIVESPLKRLTVLLPSLIIKLVIVLICTCSQSAMGQTMKEKFEATITKEKYTESDLISLLKILTDWEAVSPNDPALKTAQINYDEYYKIYKSKLPPSTGDMIQDEILKHPLNFQVRAMAVFRETNLDTQKDLCFLLIDLTYKENKAWNDDKGKKLENPEEACAAFMHRLILDKMKYQRSELSLLYAQEIAGKVLSYNPSEPNLLMDQVMFILNEKINKKVLRERKLKIAAQAKTPERDELSHSIDSLLNADIKNEKGYKKRLEKALKTMRNYYIDIESIYEIAGKYEFLNDKKNALKYYQYVTTLSKEESLIVDQSKERIKKLTNK